MRDQVLIFLLAGHETTATSLAFALHLLAKHPEQRRTARQEAERVLGGREPTAADLEAMPYVTRVVKEAMRLYPAASLLGRRAVAETVIGGLVVPAGAQVVLAPWVTHRHPDHWEEPERFDPDRFLPEREQGRHRYAWYPFGGGPRACIGQHFSMLESVLALGVLLRDFDFEAVDRDVAVGQGITLQVDGPLRIRLAPRSTGRRPRTDGGRSAGVARAEDRPIRTQPPRAVGGFWRLREGSSAPPIASHAP
ncbi:cytochrome P450 [Kitasatospora aburaviensis]